MSYISNLRIITELGELYYKQVEDLNLSFVRITDDFSDIGNKFGDFSYEFNLPITKENSKIFGSPEAIGSKNFFYRNRNISCKVYNNHQLLLDGLINLEGLTPDTYKCKFYSKFKELVDTLNESSTAGEKKTLRSLNFTPIYNWQYETSIREHIMANYADSDETKYQYPLTFYSTFYTQYSIYSGHTDYQGFLFDSDRPRENYYYLLNSVGDQKNRIFYHQLPPAIYLVSIVEQILTDAGWKLGGQFFNDHNIKKIILLYSGEDDIYDKALSGTEVFGGSTPVDLHLEKFLPDMSQSEFLKGVMNMFNLYFRIDTNNKIIEFETYDTYFKNTDDVDPYDISSKVDQSSVNISYFLNNNPSVVFKNALNRNVFGDNKVITGYTNNATTSTWVSTSNNTFNQTFNRIGYVEQSNVNLNNYVATVEKIEIPFSEPTIKRHFIWNDFNIVDSDQSAEVQNLYLPLLSKQTIADNNSMKFNKKDTEDYLFNNESCIKFQGDCALMYYYGQSTTDFENKTGKGSLSNYLYYYMYEYTGTTRDNIPIPIVSPFQLIEYRDAIQSWLTGVTVTAGTIDDRRTTICSYLQSIWQMMGTSTGVPEGKETDYSLVFDDNGYFHETLWSKFHKYKWDRYQNSELLSANMMMSSYDWEEMQINRPLKYKGELYSLVEISGYNPITQKSQIKLIKKL